MGDAAARLAHEPHVELGHDVTLLGGLAIPIDRRNVELVLRVAALLTELVVDQRKVELRLDDALGGGETKPLQGLAIVLFDAVAVGMHRTERGLGPGIALVRGHPVVLRGFGAVAFDALAGVVHRAELELGAGIALAGCEAKPAQCLCVVARHALAIGVHRPKDGAGAGIALLSKLPNLPVHGRALASQTAGVRMRVWQRGGG